MSEIAIRLVRGATCEQTCKTCRKPFIARVADVKRGWAKFCSKSCKAIKQEARTGQYANRVSNGLVEAHTINAMSPQDRSEYFEYLKELEHERDMDDAFSSHGQDENW